MSKNKTNIPYLLRETLIVVIGVLIAVSINNYIDNRSDKRYVQTTLRTIENEVKLSKKGVDTVMSKHFIIIDSIKVSVNSKAETLGEFINRMGGIQSASIKNISLRFFIANKAELVPFEIISQLSEIETNKDLLFEKMRRLIDFIYENINERDYDTKVKFTYHLANVIDSEKALSVLYAQFIDKHQEYLHD